MSDRRERSAPHPTSSVGTAAATAIRVTAATAATGTTAASATFTVASTRRNPWEPVPAEGAPGRASDRAHRPDSLSHAANRVAAPGIWTRHRTSEP